MNSTQCRTLRWRPETPFVNWAWTMRADREQATAGGSPGGMCEWWPRPPAIDPLLAAFWVEFKGDDSPVITAKVVRHIPLVVVLTDMAV